MQHTTLSLTILKLEAMKVNRAFLQFVRRNKMLHLTVSQAWSEFQAYLQAKADIQAVSHSVLV